jgi:hypothetical protein
MNFAELLVVCLRESRLREAETDGCRDGNRG